MVRQKIMNSQTMRFFVREKEKFQCQWWVRSIFRVVFCRYFWLGPFCYWISLSLGRPHPDLANLLSARKSARYSELTRSRPDWRLVLVRTRYSTLHGSLLRDSISAMFIHMQYFSSCFCTSVIFHWGSYCEYCTLKSNSLNTSFFPEDSGDTCRMLNS